MKEIEKYTGIYSDPAYKFYGHDNCGSKSLPLLGEIESLLDVGCGHNEFVKNLRSRRGLKKAIGVDFACPSADVIADATSLPFQSKEFDLVTCFDALEHLLTDQVPVALREFARVAGRFCFSICYRPSVILWKGLNLHPTVFGEEWWLERIREAGGDPVPHGRYLLGPWT